MNFITGETNETTGGGGTNLNPGTADAVLVYDSTGTNTRSSTMSIEPNGKIYTGGQLHVVDPIVYYPPGGPEGSEVSIGASAVKVAPTLQISGISEVGECQFVTTGAVGSKRLKVQHVTSGTVDIDVDLFDANNGGGGHDISSDSSVTKDNPASGSVSSVLSTVHKVKADAALLAGQPVVIKLSSGELVCSSPTVDTKVPYSTNGTTETGIIGVCLKDVAAQGDTAEVCVQGFTTVRYDTASGPITMPPTYTAVSLTGTTNNSMVIPTLPVRFTDSGGEGTGSSFHYNSNENYNIIFDAGVGNTWNLAFESWEFEHSTTSGSMFDRLGIQVSEDNVSYSNAAVSWMYQSSTTAAPWSSSRSSTSNGWIIPRVSTPSPPPGYTLGDFINVLHPSIAARFVKFTFFSDSSSTRPGWIINMISSAQITDPIANMTPLHVDSSDATKVVIPTNPNTAKSFVGYAAQQTGANNAALIYIPGGAQPFFAI